ncbi:zinc ABC transporter substrate-binding protein [Curtobacterium sp. MCBD17_003]|uniref:metal ABC transporter solute-binding protein, Zn/Mn family n=1 Tax=Curtobacterium sp. MCBD17_003 TaxID=2175667 RepID=UPI000DA9F493|nr:zinc ABC transporter substrate-binding protein [Curtobacterium sp. MCBD17_003]PZE78350.1 ABC transporter substrate-binding protein [Curtobacterium sp. MCBD17_019]WIE55189.1 zinc ABC transporter substrate-binding protein [Curtobacterium sp. MCBD17_003]
MRQRALIALAAVAGAAALGLTGCSSSGGAGGTSGSGSSASGGSGSSGRIDVVASTNVYGGLVSTIGGSHVHVTSILSDPSQDPHSFEASPRTQLAVSHADLLIENGGGYDSYMETLRDSTKSKADLIDVVKLSGLQKAGDDDFNEHVFYSYPTMVRFVSRVATELGQEQPTHKGSFRANAARVTKQLQGLEAQTAALKQQDAGDRVAYTEPVPGYLFDAIGLRNVTPQDFSEAIEEGDDVPPAALNDTLQLFSGKDPVKLLAYNDQTSSPETEQVKSAARSNHVPVVGVTETLPSGKGYIAWQQSNIDAVKKALAG